MGYVFDDRTFFMLLVFQGTRLVYNPFMQPTTTLVPVTYIQGLPGFKNNDQQLLQAG